MTQVKSGLSVSTLKWIAIAAMTVDHVAWLFVSGTSVAGQIMHVIGRTTIPIMCFLIAEGYYHTRNVRRYLLRLGLFALISHIPFMFFETRTITLTLYGMFYTSVIYSLFFALLALVVVKSETLPMVLRMVSICLLIVLSYRGDWMFLPILWVLGFGLFRDRRPLALLCAAAVSVGFWFSQMPGNYFQLGTLLALPLLWLYNGQPGNKGMKYFFYLYYPVHLVLLGLIKMVYPYVFFT